MYKIQLENFEGPFDLLLYLIRKNEVSITDIPISLITKQYLEYIQLMEMLDLDVAGEFIVMAATLIQIKVAMLLPRPEIPEIAEEETDPRTELVRRLLEYKRYKDVAEQIGRLEEKQRKLFSRSYYDYLEKIEKASEANWEPLKNVTLFDLLTALKSVIDHMPQATYHKVKRFDVTLEQQIDFVLHEINTKRRILFVEMLSVLPDRIFVVVTFMAILELIRTQNLVVRQNEPFGEIWIYHPEEMPLLTARVDEVLSRPDHEGDVSA